MKTAQRIDINRIFFNVLSCKYHSHYINYQGFCDIPPVDGLYAPLFKYLSSSWISEGVSCLLFPSNTTSSNSL